MNIFTVTLNPAFDLHLYIDGFLPYADNHVKETVREAAGKGVNLSRALKSFGIKSTTFIAVGKENADSFVSALNSQGLDLRVYYTPGKIRENITVHTPGKIETHFLQDDFTLSSDVLNELETALCDTCKEGDIVIFNGRLPKGVFPGRAIGLLRKLKNIGTKLAIDCNSFCAENLISLHPWLIKPNEREASQILGAKDEPIEAIKKLAVCADNVIISLGKRGCAFAGEDEVYLTNAPDVVAVSTVGAGDSMLAGFIKAYIEGKKPKDCIYEAVAFGSASVLRKGTLPPLPEDVRRLREKIKLLERDMDEG